MAYEYGVNLKLDSEKALKDIDALLGKLKQMEDLAGKVKLKVTTTNDIDKQQRAFLKTMQQMQSAEQKLATQRQLDAQKVAQAENKTATQQSKNAQKVAQETEKTANQRIRNAQKVAREEQKASDEAKKSATEVLRANEKLNREKQRTAQESIRTARQEEQLAQQKLRTQQQEINLAQKLLRVQQQQAAQQQKTSTVHKIGSGLTSVGSTLTGIGELGYRVTNSINAIQSTASQFVNSMFNYAQQLGSQILSQVENIASAALEQYNTLETAEIGFANFFNGDPAEFTKQVREHAEKMPGVGAQDLIRGIQYIAPQANGDSQLAIDAAEGVMKAILYSGNDVSQFGTNALQNLQQLTSGNFTYADIRQMLRAMPTLPRLLSESEEGKQLLDNGAVTTEKLKAYIKANGQSALLKLFADIGSTSAAASIYDKYAQTLSGKIEETNERLKNRWNDAMENNGVYNAIKDLLDKINKSGVITNVFNKIGEVLGNIIDFFTKQANKDAFGDLAKTGLGYLKEIGQTIKDVVKDLLYSLGVLKEDGTINVEGIKKLMKTVSDFLKGLIQGFGEGFKQLGSIVKWVAEHLGEDGWKQLGSILGWIASPLGKVITLLGTLFSSLMQILGNIATFTGGSMKTGILGNLLGGAALGKSAKASAAVNGVNTSGMSALNKYGYSSYAPGLVAGSSFMDKAKGVASKTVSGLKSLAGKAFKGLAVYAVGEVVTDFVSDFVGNVTGSNSAKQTAKDLGDVASGGLALGVALNPMAGLFGGLAVAIKKCSDAANDLKKSQQDLVTTTKKLTSTQMASHYLDTIVDNLKKMGYYEEFEDRSEDAYEAMLEQANDIAAKYKDNPEEAMRQLMEIYLRQYGRDTVAQQLNKTGEEDEGGKTAINKQDPQTKAMLKSIYDNLVAMGIIEGNGEGWADKATGSEIWNYLSRNGVTINSQEFLTSLSEQLNTAATDFNSMIEKAKTTDIQLTLNDGEESYDNIEKYMNAAGFTLDNGVWKTKVEIEAEVESTKTAAQKIHEDAKAKQDAGNGWDAFWGYMGEGVYRAIGGGNPLLPWSDTGWFNFSEGFKARGGLVKPIYRAEGGGVPTRGVDTVPTMLSPGEYVVKNSSVSKAGLGVMEALNRGDLGAAARSLGSRFTNSWNNSRSYSSVVNNNQKSVYNQVLVNNRTRAGRLNSYYSLANRLASSF